jgi:hypothetical protein
VEWVGTMDQRAKACDWGPSIPDAKPTPQALQLLLQTLAKAQARR